MKESSGPSGSAHGRQTARRAKLAADWRGAGVKLLPQAGQIRRGEVIDMV